MNRLLQPCFFLMCASVATVVTAQSVPPPMPPDQVRAQAAMADLGQRLKGALMAKMQSEGPVAAVGFCHEEAPKIAEAVSAEHGVSVGRTALRLRNLENAPKPWQAAALDAFLQQAEAGTAPGELAHVERDGKQARFARGIAVEAACLMCHGSAVAEPIQAAISARYPEDAATGFSEGDLRGLIWAEVPLEQGRQEPSASSPGAL